MYRNDLYKLTKEAESLINGCIDFDMLYEFLLDVCKAEKKRPSDLNVRIDKKFLKAGEHSAISITPVIFPDKVRNAWVYDENQIDYELLILANQERGIL